MKNKFMTVVFEIVDADKFNNLSREMIGSMAEESDYYGSKVVAVSKYDEMSRVETLEGILEEEKLGYLVPPYEVGK